MKPTVLVVDDDPIARQKLCRQIEAKGFRTLTAGHGRQALAILEDERPALIVIDLEMPVMDGWKLVQALRCYEELAAIPMVLMTERGDVTAINSRVGRTTAVLHKPLDRAGATDKLRFVLDRLPAAA